MTTDSEVYAVIFSAQRKKSLCHNDDDGYDDVAGRMADLSRRMPGFIDMHHARGADGFGITICFWESEAAIANWKRQTEHEEAQRRASQDWYTDYNVYITRVIRHYGMISALQNKGKKL